MGKFEKEIMKELQLYFPWIPLMYVYELFAIFDMNNTSNYEFHQFNSQLKYTEHKQI